MRSETANATARDASSTQKSMTSSVCMPLMMGSWRPESKRRTEGG